MGRRHSRRGDPRTSHIGGMDSAEKQLDREIVWGVFLRYDPQPLCDFMLDMIMGGAEDGKWRKRRCDLMNDGWLVAVDEWKCPTSGKPQIAWAINHPFLDRIYKPSTA